ncbi:DUF1249 domain-containing protein [Thiolapillus sp.]
MQYPWISQVEKLLDSSPTVGGLLDLCEENYRLLMRLAPDLKRLRDNLASRRPGHLDLHLEILEQTPYTTMIRLTYFFPHGEGRQADPDAVLRVYHDARQIEVIRLEQHVLPVESSYHYPSLFNKWKINVFLSKWLRFCVDRGHRFEPLEQFLTKKHG